MKLYLVELVNTDGSTQVVTAFGLDSICGLLPTVKYGELTGVQPEDTKGVGQADE